MALSQPPGSGKTFAITEVVTWARQHHQDIGSPAGAVAVMATTGMATSVLDVGATTIHSFLGTFNLDIKDYHSAWTISSKVPGVVQNLQNLRVFVLDEGTSSVQAQEL